MRRSLLIVLALAVASAVAAAAFAATGGASTILIGHQHLSSYQLTSDEDGAATVMWLAQRLRQPGNQLAQTLNVRQQNAQGAWSAPLHIGAVNQINQAQLVEAPDGAAALIWYWVQGGRGHSRTVIEASTRGSADAAWSAPVSVWSAANADGVEFSAAIDAAGNATVAWSGYGSDNAAISMATIHTSRATVSAAQGVVSAASGGQNPELAINGAGAEVLSYQRLLSTVHRGRTAVSQRFGEMAVFCPAGGRWGAPQRIGEYREPVEPASSEFWGPRAPQSVVSANGTAAVGWRDGGPESPIPLDVATRNPSSGTWTSAHRLEANLGGFSLALAANNTIVAVWSQDTARENRLLSASSADGAAWSSAEQIAHIPDGTLGPELAGDASGRIALTPLGGNHSPIQQLTRDLTGAWSAPARVGTGDNAEITFGPHGRLTLVWETIVRGGDDLETRTVG